MNDNKKNLRSKHWLSEQGEPGETAVYLERLTNYGLTRGELQSGRPIIGIAQSGSDLVPCNRIHLTLVERVKAGIREAGGVPFEFPTHPIQETGRRPTAALDRNLAYLGLVEILIGYPFDGVVLTTGCDKTTPAALMAAATTNLPAIVLSGGPMLDGYVNGKLAGTGLVLWEARRQLAEGLDHGRAVGRSRDRGHSQRRPLQLHGHCAVDEFADRSSGYVAAGLRHHSRAVCRACSVWLTLLDGALWRW